MRKQKLASKIKNRLSSRIVAFVMIAVLGIPVIPAIHTSAISDAQDKKDQAQSDLDSQKDAIDGLQQQKDNIQSEIDALDADLVNILMNMDILEDELGNKQAELEQVTESLQQVQEDEKQQYANMKKRIQYMYENGESSVLSMILGASDFADFLNRVEYASQVYTYDRDLLTAYQDTKEQIAQLKLQAEGDKAELEQMQESYAEQQQELEEQIAVKKGKVSDFNGQLADAKELAEKYKNIISKQNQKIQEEQEKEDERKRQEEAAKNNSTANNNSNNNNSNSNANNTAGNNSGSNSNSNSSGNTNTDNNSESSNSGGSGADPGYSTSISGSDVVNYACQFIGNPYVYGGTSLTEGCDCSGFVMSVYANFGISLPHSSYALQSCGKEVSYSNAKPGDLICYAGHVAIYIGNGQIVNASSSAPYPIGGIKTNSATYRQIVAVRRVL